MDRRQGHRSGAVQVAHGQRHPEFELYGGPADADAYRAAGPSRFRLLMHATGTVASLAVIGLCGYWGYQQIMRDMHGVPVVRALEGPVRVAPDDPGGQVADHPGLAVNAVQAVGSASAPEDRLTLAPAPVALTDDDLPVGKLAAAGEEAEVDLVASTEAEADDAELVIGEPVPQMARLSEDLPDDDPVARALALADASTAGAMPLSEDTETGDLSGISEETASAASPSGHELPSSPRPAPRPARRTPEAPGDVSPTTAAVLAALDTSAAPTMLEASAVPPGTRLVQLGAFDSPEDARSAWASIASRFDGLMEDKTQVVVEAKAGGRTFWRLRAMGFADLSEARRFCAALVAERADCIPVVAK